VKEVKKKGILLVNLGTPSAPTFFAIRRYLQEFLSDAKVIEVNRILWWCILNFIILTIRPFKLIHLYQSIWTSKGSPLLVESEAQVRALQEKLGENYAVALGMRYGSPSLKEGLLLLRKAEVSEVIVLPLYPQYAGATTGSTFLAVTQSFNRCRHTPKFTFIPEYFEHPLYIEAMKRRIGSFWEVHGRPQQLLLSFHGLPERYVAQGDPYERQCRATAQALAKALDLSENEYAISFQSRVGREPWLRPYTDELLQEWPQQGVKNIHVFCPGFAADCLETLEEIAVRNKEDFLRAGGDSYFYIPALNDSDAHIQMMVDLVTLKEKD
jgi:ferrochelatase